MNTFVGTLDTYLIRQGYLISPGSTDGIRKYSRGPLTLLIEPNSSGRSERIGEGDSAKHYRGSELRFTITGNVREDLTEKEYRQELERLESAVNEEIKNLGCQIIRRSPSYLNGRNELKIPTLELEYGTEISYEKRTEAIGILQKHILELLSKYARS